MSFCLLRDKVPIEFEDVGKVTISLDVPGPRQSVSRFSRRQTLASRSSTHAGSQGLATGRAWRICDDRSCKALRKSHRVAEIWRDLDRCR